MTSQASGGGSPREGRGVLILGGTGFIGSAIAAAYVRSGARVIVAARHDPPNPLPVGMGVVRGDVVEPGFMERALTEIDFVVYAVGTRFPAESNLNPADDAAETLPGLIRLLEALRNRPGVGLSFISSGGTVYGNQAALRLNEDAPTWPITSYGVMKVAAEKYVAMYSALYGIPAMILRVANAYGSGQRAGRGQGAVAEFLHATRVGRPVTLFGDGLAVRDYVHVDDVSAAAVALSQLSSGPLIVNVGTGVGHNLRAVLDNVQAVTRQPLTVETREGRAFDVKSVVLDPTLLSSLIDWRPLDLRCGLQRAWDDISRDSHPIL